MHEYEVWLNNGTAWIYADNYTVKDGVYCFTRNGDVVEEIEADRVLSVRDSDDE